MYLPTNLRPIAQAARMDAADFLLQHTVFPFAVAFMEPAVAKQLAHRALSLATSAVSLGSLVRSVTANGPGLRFCAQCAADDFRTLGESYWHRTHCLPAVHVCLRHRLPLYAASPRPRTVAQYLLAPLPHRQPRGEAHTACPEAFVLPLAQAVHRTLDAGWTHRADWLSYHRANAFMRRYRLPGNYVAGAQLAADIRQAYGERYLSELGCGYRSPLQAWPALMTREHPGTPFAPVKHLLLDTFLKHDAPDRAIFVYQPPGKKPADLAALDERLAALVMKEAARLLANQETGTVTSLLEATGHWQTFRHKRKSLPLTVEQVEAFKRTDASERRTGGREAHAKRLKAIAEGRQKPFKPWSDRPRGVRQNEGRPRKAD